MNPRIFIIIIWPILFLLFIRIFTIEISRPTKILSAIFILTLAAVTINIYESIPENYLLK